MDDQKERNLEQFLHWLNLNGVEMRGCKIKYCNSPKGYGLFACNEVSEGVLLVVPLDLAITPMRVLQDPLLGPECRFLLEKGDVDDRLLMILFLTVERVRRCSSWKAYVDMLPATFYTPLCFNESELLELAGTTLYVATDLQKKKLQALYNIQIKPLVDKILALSGTDEREVSFGDFLWANCVFWTRAQNIPFPNSYVFPRVGEEKGNSFCCSHSFSRTSTDAMSATSSCEIDGVNRPPDRASERKPMHQGDMVWVEGLVPVIDFCNHDLNSKATWEVDAIGSTTGVPLSMCLLSDAKCSIAAEDEISISYGNKGNEELLYLYGFVVENNPDDYLMVYYPIETLDDAPFPDCRGQLLEAQRAELRCLLPRSLLSCGLFSEGCTEKPENVLRTGDCFCSYSWSGHRKRPSYSDKLVFPQEFLTALRTIALEEGELFQVQALLEELVGSGGSREPSDEEVRAAVWEACGDSGALKLLVDILKAKLLELEVGTGSEDLDRQLLEEAHVMENVGQCRSGYGPNSNLMSRNKWSCVVYRHGQKQLARLFLKEAEAALRQALHEEAQF